MQEKMTELFEKYGVFFAFSKKQFDEQKKEGVEYASFGAGGLLPESNLKAFNEAFENLCKEETAFNLANFSKEELILNELLNQEAFYTYHISDTFDYLNSKYNFSREDIQEVFDKHKEEYS